MSHFQNNTIPVVFTLEVMVRINLPDAMTTNYDQFGRCFLSVARVMIHKPISEINDFFLIACNLPNEGFEMSID